MELTRQELWFWLCNMDGIGRKKIYDLLEYYGELEYIFHAKEEELKQIYSFQKRNIVTFLNGREEKKIKSEYNRLSKRGVSFLTLDDEAYPRRLRELCDYPYGLYMMGRLPLEQGVNIGIVGARNCSQYGKEIAIHFANQLARAGVQIISGLARGIDGYGHHGALMANGYTLGVLGSGIDYCYPTENIELYMELEKRGGVLSEYGLGVLPKPCNFPLRNRIISGLSDGILVVEAKEKSGSLITVDQALEQGKDVFVVPGRITDPLSAGCNNLIKMGAQLVSSPNDILDVYNLQIQAMKKVNGPIKLSAKEQKIYDELTIEPKHVNEIALQVKMQIAELMGILVKLELSDYIRQSPKNYYSTVLKQ